MLSTSMEVLREILYRYSSLGRLDLARDAVMLNNEVEWIATFDSGFDQIAGVRRVKLS